MIIDRSTGRETRGLKICRKCGCEYRGDDCPRCTYDDDEDQPRDKLAAAHAEIELPSAEISDQNADVDDVNEKSKVSQASSENWPGVSQSAREAAEVLGDLVPTVHPQKKEAKGWIGDRGGTSKVYYTSEDLRTVARGCLELAQFLDDRAIGEDHENE